MDQSEFDDMLRSALMDAIRLEWAQVLEEPQPEPHFSARYLREREKLLKDPFGYAKRKTRPLWKKAVRLAASVLLVISIGLGGILVISPEARAWVVERLSVIWGDKFAFFSAPGHQGGTIDISHYQPTYIPDGFELVEKWVSNEFFFNYTYENGAGGYIDYMCASLSAEGAFDFMLDDEHSDSDEIQINGLPATIMISNTEGWPNHLVWMDGEVGAAYCITTTVGCEEMIHIGESIAYVR